MKFTNEKIDEMVDKYSVSSIVQMIDCMLNNVELFYDTTSKLVDKKNQDNISFPEVIINFKLGKYDDIEMSAEEYDKFRKVFEEYERTDAFNSVKNAFKFWLKYFNRLCE